MGCELSEIRCGRDEVAGSRARRGAGRLLPICALMLMLPGLATAERQLYRYQTESGAMVQSDRLPAGAAAGPRHVIVVAVSLLSTHTHPYLHIMPKDN